MGFRVRVEEDSERSGGKGVGTGRGVGAGGRSGTFHVADAAITFAEGEIWGVQDGKGDFSAVATAFVHDWLIHARSFLLRRPEMSRRLAVLVWDHVIN